MKFVFAFSTILLFASNLKAQCCAAGNPVGGDGSITGSSKNELLVFTSLRHSISRRYYKGGSPISNQPIKRSFYNYQNFSITYGLLNRLSVHSEIGYFYNKVQDVEIAGDDIQIRSHGLGDLAVNLRYIPIKTVSPTSLLLISGGIKIPIGEFNEEMSGVTIPISLQPSSGAIKYNASVFYSIKPSGAKLGWNSLAMFETSKTIEKGYLVYTYGNYFQYALACAWLPVRELSFTLNVKFEWRDRDKRENNIKVVSTGSHIIYLNPQFTYVFAGEWSILAMADFPFYKHVNGEQLTNMYSFQIGLRKNIVF